MPVRAFIAGLIVVGMTIGSPALAAQDDAPSLGISKSFPENAVVVVTPGQTLPPEQSIKVDNAGPRPAEVQWETNAPAGITVEPSVSKATIPSGDSLTIPFSITVADTVAGGRYPVGINVKQTNVKPPEGGGITVAPAVGANLILEVRGATADVTLRGVSKESGTPVTGQLTLGQARDGGLPVVVARTTGESLTARIAPGRYVGSFDVPGLVHEETVFEIADGETKDVAIEVTTVAFVVADALPQPSLDAITSAKLVASLQNNLKKLAGPLTLSAEVSRDGELIDTVDIRTFDSLPHGLTDGSGTYVPSQGWSPGEYTFRFLLTSEQFQVSSPAQQPIVIGRSLLLPLAIAAAVIALLGWILWRRRRDRASGR
ncbi:MAG: hypothetical protein U0R64_09635 [Candidatus Nanopelagicales bacterium]